MADQRLLYEDTARNVASKYGIPPDVFVAMIGKESGWDPDAQAPGSTAHGLGQMVKGTAAQTGTNVYDPGSQLDGSARYLRQQYDKFGDWHTALAAYNQGPGAARTPAGQQYARNVMGGKDSSVDALLALPDVGENGDHPPEVQSLLALPDVAPVADTSDPKGNMDPRDIRQTQDYANTLEEAKPSWMARVRQGMTVGGPAGRAALELAQPGVGNAVARRAVPVAVGAPGDFIDFAANKVPQFFGREGLGGHTGLPTSEDISGVLSRAGWADQRDAHPIASQMGTALGSVVPVGEAARAVVNPIVQKTGQVLADYGAGGQIGRDINRFGQQVANLANMRRAKIVDDVRAPDVKPGLAPVRQGEAPIKPAENWSVEGLPGVRKDGRPAAPQDLDTEFENSAFATKEGIKAEKTDIRSTMEWQRMTKKPEVDLEPIKDHLTGLIENSAGPGRKAAIAARQHVEEIENIQDPVARFEQLDQFKRELAKRGGFEAGTDASGYAAIAEKQSRELRNVVDTQLKDWKPFEKYTTDYANASAQEAKANFLKNVGEPESGASFMRGAFKGPKNVALAKKALGEGGDAKFDEMASHYVVSQLQGKSASAIEKWSLKNEATLRELPQAAQTVLRMQQRADRVLAEQGLYETALKQHATNQAIDVSALTGALNAQKSQEAAEAAARATARSLTPAITAVQVAKTPKEQATAIGGLINELHGKGMIDDAQYKVWAEQLSAMQKSASRQAALQTMAKYISYAVTGNYLVSFGGPAAAKYIAAAAK